MWMYQNYIYLLVLNDSMCMLTPTAIATSSSCSHNIPLAANIMLINMVSHNNDMLNIFILSGIDLFS